MRDFRGVPTKSFDGRGNYTLGIRDHLIFPEIDYNKVERSKGMNVTIVTTAENDEQALHLLRELGMPFASELRRRRVATDARIAKTKSTPKFNGAAAQPLQALRTAARLPAEVRALPHLFPRSRSAGLPPGRDQGELVRRDV